ncbi:26S protease regulatory subunit 6a [Culex quinquefasciatus]|uniref:26S protease regulatory subunit 6a n=1 Tax=Culex quinquefasciatus TaxID=7176 RepID=B0X3Y3_CULQU|nr:26S protease regulatory subunit 6a [Culex quinquefasciatus]|eukprot:XP_001864355.1 26S protease regulatory subunit 6a [Culex quinquefasciatus]
MVTLEDKSIELLVVDPQETEEYEAAVVVLDSQRKGKRAVIKTSTRQTHFLPYKACVKAIEVDERTTELYKDIGRLDKQIQELIEAARAGCSSCS